MWKKHYVGLLKNTHFSSSRQCSQLIIEKRVFLCSSSITILQSRLRFLKIINMDLFKSSTKVNENKIVKKYIKE